MPRKKSNFALMRLCILAVGLSSAVAAGTYIAHAQAPPAPNPSPFGPNVYVITPTMSTSAINGLLNSLNQEAQFSTNRYAVLFQPGTYGSSSNPVGAQVGYYEQISGLGALPNAVAITGGMGVDQLIGTAPTADMTQNFWRSMENFSERAASGATGILDWGVSQGASLRRMNIQSNLWYANSGPINGENACQQSSGGFMADSVVVGQVNACSQQQWYTRNSNLPGGFSGNVWNFVFSGVVGAPNASYPGGSVGDDNMTVLPTTPVSREKPYLHVDSSGNYYVFVPSAQQNSSGISWASGQTPGFDAPIGAFYIATPSSSITDINNALAGSKSLILTPGIYKYNDAIHVTQPGTVVLGMGFATIVPQNGNPGMIVDDVDNVQIAGLLFDAGPVYSQVLLEVGQQGVVNNNHENQPSSINDVFFRIGGATAGTVDTALQVDSGNVILDNIWAWRADHGNPGTYGWTVNTAAHGVVVNGTFVEALGLAVEHFQQEQTLWNGEGGKTIFYQSELPYDPPNQAAWSNGSQNGYPSYVVSPSAGCGHQAYGLGIYSYFDQNVNIVEDNAISTSNTVGTSITDAGTVFLNGSGQITNVINGTGGLANTANRAKLVPVTQFSGTTPCQNNQLALPVGSTVSLLSASDPVYLNSSYYNPNDYDTPQIFAALDYVRPDVTVIAAHRGIHALVIPKTSPTQIQAPNIPENTLQAIDQAAHDGWEAAEIDIQSTSDHTPILSHDKTWGKEWCSWNPNHYYAPTYSGPFDPVAIPRPLTPGSDPVNNAKDPLVTNTSLYNTRYWNYDLTVTRDSINLVNDTRSGYVNGCRYGDFFYRGKFPPTLQDVFTEMNKNHIHMLLFLDVKTAAAAADIWNVLDPQNGNPPLDDKGRPYYNSVIFKMDAKNFPTLADYYSTFSRDSQKVKFMPLFTSGSLPEIKDPNTGAMVADTEDAGFDATADVGANAFSFADIQAMKDWLTSFERASPQVRVVAVETVRKEPNGILTPLYDFAQTNQWNGAKMAVADFNAVGEYYPSTNGELAGDVPKDFHNGNVNATFTPMYYRSSDGTCCDYLTHYLYNNPDGDPTGNHRIDNTAPFDGSDQRSDPTFIASLNFSTINSDYPTGLLAVLGAGRHNTCYYKTSYNGGVCGTGITSSPGLSPGRYTILNINSGLALEVNGNSTTPGASIDQWPSNYGLNQQWAVTSLGAGLFTLSAYNDGLCLDVYQGSVQTGATLDQYTCNSSATNQQFLISQASDGNYTIVGSESLLAVEVPKGSLTAGTTLDQWTPNGGKNQEWQFIHPGPAPGTYTITNQNSGLLMEVGGNSTATGAAIDQWTSNNGTNQKWKISTQSNGIYQIQNVNSNLCLDVPGASTTPGTSLDQWTCNNGSNQQYTIASGPGGTYTIAVGGLAVEVPKASTAAGTVLDQWTVNGGTNQQWVFTAVN
jgi:glycerophosphoryl diester phosphodiesterase